MATASVSEVKKKAGPGYVNRLCLVPAIAGTRQR
jgi:hypothetical protein